MVADCCFFKLSFAFPVVVSCNINGMGVDFILMVDIHILQSILEVYKKYLLNKM